MDGIQPPEVASSEDRLHVVCDTSATAPAQQGPRDIRWICHTPSSTVRDLGVMLDSKLSMDVRKTVVNSFVIPRVGGTAAAAPPPFRPGNPALCGSRPLVTPYYCRLGDLLCYTCMLYLSNILCVLCMCNLCFLCFLVFFLYNFLLQYFDTVGGWVF